ncbi:NAD(P)H:quinone oxidoreductase, type IV [Kwoniella newhampshirensis]|uniref:NAD(P)H:quinone oxidoreductase, type IV n=1 Tax=Kwoniella newhampshirensis TaxID=1651941 RepID=A0AAW0Z5W7_9TREE
MLPSGAGAVSVKPVIAVAFYSTYGHIAALAEEVIKGVESTGAIVKPYFIQETLPEEVLTKMYAGSSLNPKYPILTPDALKEADGLILGAPTRYGRLPAQVSAFFDATGGLWATGALTGKFVTMFTSAAGQHSGHESTAWTSLPMFFHHGMAYVPIVHPITGAIKEIQGGSPYGASTVAGSDGSRQPLPQDLELAQYQGKYFADFVTTFVKGKHAQTAKLETSTAALALGEPFVAGQAAEKETSTTAQPATDGHAAAKDSAPASAVKPTENTTATAAAAQSAATTQPSSTTATSTPAEKPTPAAPAAAPKKKKGGLFASCCGGNGIDD